MYGPNPQGQQILDANGRYSLIITRSDIPKFASNNREAGTPEENKAAVQGSIAFFGTYTVDESAKTLTQHVESCSLPNFNWTDRKLSFSKRVMFLSRAVYVIEPLQLGTDHATRPCEPVQSFSVSG